MEHLHGDYENLVSYLDRFLEMTGWVPGKDGKLYKPDNIEETDISNDLVFDNSNSILIALHFGEGVRRRKREIGEMERIAAREHLRLIPEKEYQEFLAWKEHKK